MEALEPDPPPYDESRVDWHKFWEDQDGHARVEYESSRLAQHCRTPGIPEEDGRRRWRQLMYFFASVSVMVQAGSFTYDTMPTQPPPLLEGLWHMFLLQCPNEAADYCKRFFSGHDVCWRHRYQQEHRLTADRLKLVRGTAELIGFEVDNELWRF